MCHHGAMNTDKFPLGTAVIYIHRSIPRAAIVIGSKTEDGIEWRRLSMQDTNHGETRWTTVNKLSPA